MIALIRSLKFWNTTYAASIGIQNNPRRDFYQQHLSSDLKNTKNLY